MTSQLLIVVICSLLGLLSAASAPSSPLKSKISSRRINSLDSNRNLELFNEQKDLEWEFKRGMSDSKRINLERRPYSEISSQETVVREANKYFDKLMAAENDQSQPDSTSGFEQFAFSVHSKEAEELSKAINLGLASNIVQRPVRSATSISTRGKQVDPYELGARLRHSQKKRVSFSVSPRSVTSSDSSPENSPELKTRKLSDPTILFNLPINLRKRVLETNASRRFSLPYLTKSETLKRLFKHENKIDEEQTFTFECDDQQNTIGAIPIKVSRSNSLPPLQNILVHSDDNPEIPAHLMTLSRSTPSPLSLSSRPSTGVSSQGDVASSACHPNDDNFKEWFSDDEKEDEKAKQQQPVTIPKTEES